MKAYYKLAPVLLVTGILCGYLYLWESELKSPNKNNYPLPTNGIAIREGQVEGDSEGDPRGDWEKMIHSAAPGDDWQAIERENMLTKYQYRSQLKEQAAVRSQQTFANGKVTGAWSEKGSNNQAGSVSAVDFDYVNDQIYAITPSGTLWKGDLSGITWTPLNENLSFYNNIIEVTQTPTNTRIITAIGPHLYYSDNDGASWTPSEGLTYSQNAGAPTRIMEVADANNSIYYLAQIGTAINLYVSTNHGKDFTQIHSFSNYNNQKIDFWSALGEDDAYLLDAESNLYNITPTAATLINNTSLPVNTWRRLTGSKASGSVVLYAFLNKRDVYQSLDNGMTWTNTGSTPINSWNVGIIASPWTATKLFMGEVNTHQSDDSGETWFHASLWYHYYTNINRIHADVMTFGAYETSNGTPLVLIGSHGGVHASYDELETTENVATQQLNNAEYYDIRTNPIFTDQIYAGSQDQGWQRTATGNTSGAVDFEQALSGDYGNLALTNNGQHLWTVYPFGILNFFTNPQSSINSQTINVNGSNPPASNWLWPTSETHDLASDDIYLGGGSLDGGPGSYLITLTGTSTAIDATQFDYDFRANSNSGTATISAISPSFIDADKIFVATSDGTFFYTHDAGQTWAKSANILAGQHNLYGATIYASKHDPNRVWMAGSGYSNPPVFQSNDGGATFTPINNGLPNTLINKLTANPDETLLFAASESGAYVYDIATKIWYDFLGTTAPQQRYLSVEYVKDLNIVRFGTFGRGIWDFTIASQPALPVEWLSFDAKSIDNQQVALNWRTASEFENDYFEIQRSANGKDFEAIAEVNSLGMGDVERNYDFVDHFPQLGNNYYRIKQVDRDGSFEYSDIQLAVIEGDQPTIAIYPNPVIAGENVQVKISKEGEFSLAIFNLNGQLVEKQTISENQEVETQNLPAGNYFYQVNQVGKEVNFAGKIMVSGQ